MNALAGWPRTTLILLSTLAWAGCQEGTENLRAASARSHDAAAPEPDAAASLDAGAAAVPDAGAGGPDPSCGELEARLAREVSASGACSVVFRSRYPAVTGFALVCGPERFTAGEEARAVAERELGLSLGAPLSPGFPEHGFVFLGAGPSAAVVSSRTGRVVYAVDLDPAARDPDPTSLPASWRTPSELGGDCGSRAPLAGADRGYDLGTGLGFAGPDEWLILPVLSLGRTVLPDAMAASGLTFDTAIVLSSAPKPVGGPEPVESLVIVNFGRYD
jgi:hypothetical protein